MQLIADWTADPVSSSNMVKKGRGQPYPDFAADIDFARAIGVQAWELEQIPYFWYRRLEIYHAAQGRAAEQRRKSGGT